MKIIHYSSGNFPRSSSGGPLKIIYLLISSKHLNHYHQYILTNSGLINFNELKNSIGNREEYSKNKFYYNYIKGPMLARLSSIKRDLTIHKNIKHINKFIFHNHFSGSSTLLAKYLNKYAIPNIVTFHSKGSMVNEIDSSHGVSRKHIFSRYIYAQERYVIKNSNIVTFPSKASFELMKKSHPEINFESIDVRIVYNGIDNNFINKIISKKVKKTRTNTKIKIINVAQHIEQKQIDKTLEVLEILKGLIDFEFLNIGDGKLFNDNLRKVKEKKLEREVKFLSKQPYEKVIELLYESDIFLMTSKDVVFDLITLEAMYIGLPVLVSADGGNLELINNFENGFLISPEKPEETARLILQLKENRELYNKISNNARKTIIDRYTLENMINGYKEIYDELNLKYYGKKIK